MKKYVYASLFTALLLGNSYISGTTSENEETWSDWLDVVYDVAKQGIDKAKPYVDKGIEIAKPVVSQGVEFAKTKIEEGKEVIAKAKAKAQAEKSLWEGVRSNNVELVRSSLEQGAYVDCKGHRGETPLHRAAASGNSALVELLVSFDADVEKQDDYNMRPIDVAQSNGHTVLVKFLQKAAARRKAQVK